MLKTWDIFDTLIARRGVHPHSIFSIVENTTKLKGFAEARIAAEKNLVNRGGNYGIDDIYSEFEKISNLPKNVCAQLKQLEIDVEIDQCIPITENLRQVKSGDVLISDMYLPEKIIRKMLDKVGLLVPVEVVVTSGGKSSGRIWKQLADQNEFVFHVGDNINSDVLGVRKYKFDSALSVSSQPNQFEQWLMQRDFNFGAYLREIRLCNPFTEEIKRTYWTVFTLNVGVLMVLVRLIDELQKKYGFEYLGFCGRDTYYLWRLYKRFKEDATAPPPESDYIYYSRKLMYSSGKDMIKYFANKINNRKALLIDLLGTGTNLNKIRYKEKLKYSMLICCVDRLNEAEKTYPNEKVYPKNWISSFDVDAGEIDLSSANFTFAFKDEIKLPFIKTEHLNRATHNTPIKINLLKIGKQFVPHVDFSDASDTENADVLEACIQEVLSSKIVFPAGNDYQAFIDLLKPMFQILANWVEPAVLVYNHSIIESVEIMFRKNFVDGKYIGK